MTQFCVVICGAGLIILAFGLLALAAAIMEQKQRLQCHPEADTRREGEE